MRLPRQPNPNSLFTPTLQDAPGIQEERIPHLSSLVRARVAAVACHILEDRGVYAHLRGLAPSHIDDRGTSTARRIRPWMGTEIPALPICGVITTMPASMQAQMCNMPQHAAVLRMPQSSGSFVLHGQVLLCRRRLEIQAAICPIDTLLFLVRASLRPGELVAMQGRARAMGWREKAKKYKKQRKNGVVVEGHTLRFYAPGSGLRVTVRPASISIRLSPGKRLTGSNRRNGEATHAHLKSMIDECRSVVPSSVLRRSPMTLRQVDIQRDAEGPMRVYYDVYRHSDVNGHKDESVDKLYLRFQRHNALVVYGKDLEAWRDSRDGCYHGNRIVRAEKRLRMHSSSGLLGMLTHPGAHGVEVLIDQGPHQAAVPAWLDFDVLLLGVHYQLERLEGDETMAMPGRCKIKNTLDRMVEKHLARTGDIRLRRQNLHILKRIMGVRLASTLFPGMSLNEHMAMVSELLRRRSQSGRSRC